MGLINCSLASFKVPGFTGLNPNFGTKMADGEPITSRDNHNNVAMAFMRQRPFPVNENSTAESIEANSVFEIKTAAVTLTLDDAAFNGCTATIVNSASGTATIAYASPTGATTIAVAGNSITRLEFNDYWNIAASGGGNVYNEYEDLPRPGIDGKKYFVLTDDLVYQYNGTKTRYEIRLQNFASFPVTGIPSRFYFDIETDHTYTWETFNGDSKFAEHYDAFASFPGTGSNDRYYVDEGDDNRVYIWDESLGMYETAYATMSDFPVSGNVAIIYLALDSNLLYLWTGTAYVTKEGGSGAAGSGDNTSYSEESLLAVLGVQTVAEAIEELHKRINNEGTTGEYLSGIKTGMYLDLPSLSDGSTTFEHNESYQNLRVRIAGFNSYLNTDNTEKHIAFDFKNCPTEKQMRTDNTNDGGYTKVGGTTVLKPYLEGGFLTGLKAALGHDYMYAVKRKITGGSQGTWTKTLLTAAIFPPTEKEVFGTNTYGDATTEGELSQLPIFVVNNSNSFRVKKLNGSAKYWWEGSPNASNTTDFCNVYTNGNADDYAASSADGVSPCFCIA